MRFLLILIFIVVPIAELALLIQVGQAIGVWWTIALLIADSILGSLLMRSQGRSAWRRFNVSLQAGNPPVREVLDGVLVIFGGALLLTPGFISDFLGLILLLPPTRALVRAILVRRFADRMIASATTPRRDGRLRASARARRPRRPGDVEGTAVDVDTDGLPRGTHVSGTVLTGGEGFTDAVTFAFADRAAGFFGLARAGVASGPDGLRGSALGVLFAGREPVGVLAEGDNALGAGGGLGRAAACPGSSCGRSSRASAGRSCSRPPAAAGFDLEFTAVSPPAELEEDDDAARLGGMAGHEQLCRVSGTAAGHKIDCLGQRGRTWGVADWSRIALTRSLAAWLEDGTSLTVAAVRPTGAESHADEATWGALLDADGAVAVADPRVSTTYDGDGHQRRAGLELWVSQDDDYPRRGAGQILCGSSVELGQLRLDCAFFVWQVDGREGVGRYDLLRRA